MEFAELIKTFQAALENLETIDDDAADFQFSIKLVKMDDKQEAEVKSYSIFSVNVKVLIITYP